MGDLVTLTSGQSPSGFKFGPTGTPYYKVDQLGRSQKYLWRSSTPYFSSSLPHVPAGSVLIAKRGGAIALNRVRVLTEPSFMDTNVMALTPGTEIDSEFLFYWLGYRGLWDIADVTSVPQINNKHIKPLQIALPGIAEQRKIARALRGADDLIAGLERMIAKKHAIRQGMVQELLMGKTRLPGFTEPWTGTTLGALGTILKGRGVKREDVRRSGVRCIRYGELYTSFQDYTAEARSFVAPEVAATALPLRTGDVMFAGSGETRDEIGKCIAYIGPEPAVAGGDVIVLRGEPFNSVFLALLANSPEVVRQKSRAGQGDAVVHIYGHAIAAIKVNLPQRAEQDAIAESIVDADREIGVLCSRLAKARNVTQGMMQQLLTGRTRLPMTEGVT